MTKLFTRYLIGLITLGFAHGQTCNDFEYNYDYESHPYQPFNYEHLELTLTLDKEKALLSGVVTYTLSPKTEGTTSVYLKANELAIDAVSVNEQEVEYRVASDSLLIFLPDTAKAGLNFDVTVSWQSTSRFGLYLDAEGNFWSSKNPLAHHFWFPVFDHPRVETTFDAWFNIPAQMEVMFNGDMEGTPQISGAQKKVHWKSETQVPVTGLGFALGNFELTEATAGFQKVRLFSPEKDIDQSQREVLVREAAQLKRRVENALSLEYPWDALNIVVLKDNYWEERSYGTGTVFLYENLGSLSAQLSRGIYAQWFGEYHRQEQFFDGAGNMDMLRTALHYSLNREPLLIDNPDTLNSIWEWNRWQSTFRSTDPDFQRVVTKSLPALMRQVQSGVISFEEYAEIWYQETGIPWFELSLPEALAKESAPSDEITYKLDVGYDDLSGEADIIFSLQSGTGGELYSLNLIEYTFTDTTSHEILFTGDSDTVSIDLSPSTEFVSFEDGSVSLEQISFGEYPLFFLLNQLRSTDKKDRLLAARLVSQYSNNPDLQLAINDVLSFEQDPEVRAALYSTLSGITGGATGTEQEFLNGLNSNDPKVVLSSLGALANYPDNEMVRSSVRNKVIRAESDTVFSTALKYIPDSHHQRKYFPWLKGFSEPTQPV